MDGEDRGAGATLWLTPPPSATQQPPFPTHIISGPRGGAYITSLLAVMSVIQKCNFQTSFLVCIAYLSPHVLQRGWFLADRDRAYATVLRPSVAVVCNVMYCG